MVQEERQRDTLKNSAASLEEYLATLDLEIEVREPLDAEWAAGCATYSTHQSIQFVALSPNTGGGPRAEGGHCPRPQARDRFGDYGLVGVCILNDAPVTPGNRHLADELRALGRGAEDAFLHAIARAAIRQGAQRLVAHYVEGRAIV
jgi:predicted enzyme involved in methoxymalonyl-ACP biosynthesis